MSSSPNRDATAFSRDCRNPDSNGLWSVDLLVWEIQFDVDAAWVFLNPEPFNHRMVSHFLQVVAFYVDVPVPPSHSSWAAMAGGLFSVVGHVGMQASSQAQLNWNYVPKVGCFIGVAHQSLVNPLVVSCHDEAGQFSQLLHLLSSIFTRGKAFTQLSSWLHDRSCSWVGSRGWASTLVRYRNGLVQRTFGFPFRWSTGGVRRYSSHVRSHFFDFKQVVHRKLPKLQMFTVVAVAKCFSFMSPGNGHWGCHDPTSEFFNVTQEKQFFDVTLTWLHWAILKRNWNQLVFLHLCSR